MSNYDELIQDRLGVLAGQPLDGIEVLTVECSEDENVYSGTEADDIFTGEVDYGESFEFEIDPDDGSAVYLREGPASLTSIKTNVDGSGEFIEDRFGTKLSIEAFVDGSGRYYHKEPSLTTTIDADAEGAGVFYRQSQTTLMTITIGNDGSGALFSETETDLLTIDARSDGSGDMYFKTADRIVTLRIRGDGSWELSDRTFGSELGVMVNADGSGHYRERGTRAFALDFAPDGSTIGPNIVLPSTPQFAVVDRFPELGTLARITPPCATILRFDSSLLFAVNKSTVLPEAAAVLDEVAPALIEANQPIEVNGHTDATGSDEDNLGLSLRRAQSIADELVARGVRVELTINGFGESQPVAPNYKADGSDNEAGQRQNRRVELVLHG